MQSRIQASLCNLTVLNDPQKAADTRAKFRPFCTLQNANSHFYYAQNLIDLIRPKENSEAECHLRTMADIFLVLEAFDSSLQGPRLISLEIVFEHLGWLQEVASFSVSSSGVQCKQALQFSRSVCSRECHQCSEVSEVFARTSKTKGTTALIHFLRYLCEDASSRMSRL